MRTIAHIEFKVKLLRYIPAQVPILRVIPPRTLLAIYSLASHNTRDNSTMSKICQVVPSVMNNQEVMCPQGNNSNA